MKISFTNRSPYTEQSLREMVLGMEALTDVNFHLRFRCDGTDKLSMKVKANDARLLEINLPAHKLSVEALVMGIGTYLSGYNLTLNLRDRTKRLRKLVTLATTIRIERKPKPRIPYHWR